MGKGGEIIPAALRCEKERLIQLHRMEKQLFPLPVVPLGKPGIGYLRLRGNLIILRQQSLQELLIQLHSVVQGLPGRFILFLLSPAGLFRRFLSLFLLLKLPLCFLLFPLPGGPLRLQLCRLPLRRRQSCCGSVTACFRLRKRTPDFPLFLLRGFRLPVVLLRRLFGILQLLVIGGLSHKQGPFSYRLQHLKGFQPKGRGLLFFPLLLCLQRLPILLRPLLLSQKGFADSALFTQRLFQSFQVPHPLFFLIHASCRSGLVRLLRPFPLLPSTDFVYCKITDAAQLLLHTADELFLLQKLCPRLPIIFQPFFRWIGKIKIPPHGPQHRLIKIADIFPPAKRGRNQPPGIFFLQQLLRVVGKINVRVFHPFFLIALRLQRPGKIKQPAHL